MGDDAFSAGCVGAGVSMAEVLDAGQDQNVGGAGQRCGNGGQAVRVLLAQCQGPQPVSSADLAADPVVHLTDVARLHGWQDETWSIAQQVMDPFLCELKLG